MNQENALPRRKAMLYYPSQPKPRPVRLREKDRDPYDGLRPWSAITHGIGAALALLGTVLLLLRCAALSLSPWHVGSFLIYTPLSTSSSPVPIPLSAWWCSAPTVPGAGPCSVSSGP